MKKIFILVAASLALAACDNSEDNPVTPPRAVKITAIIAESTPSRASDTEWSTMDAIGISSNVGGVTRPYNNVKYTTTKGDGVFTGDSLFYYNQMTLIAYYPFTGTEGIAPGIVEARTDINYQTSENQPRIDFLWDSKTNVGSNKDFSADKPNVNFTFSHKMSKLTFTFQSSEAVYDKDDPTLKISDGVDVRDMVSYGIEKLGIEGTFNTNSGVCAINDKREGLTIDCERITINEADKYKYNREFSSLIVFPQKNTDGYILHIYTDELNDKDNLQHYKCNLTFSEGEIKPGYHYKYTIKVTKMGLIVGKMTVEPWAKEERYMTATIDGDKVFN